MPDDEPKSKPSAIGLAISVLIIASGAWLFYLLTYRVGGTATTRQAWALAGSLLRLAVVVVVTGLVCLVVHMALFPRRVCPFCGATWWGRRRECLQCERRPAAMPPGNAECDTIKEEMDSDRSAGSIEKKGE